MRRVIILFSMILCCTIGLVAAGESTAYGDGVTIEDPVPVETLLGSPDEYLGERVRVDGVITGVCKKRGCWMQVTDPETGNGVRIKVDDGVIVFPYTAMGKKASAEGVFDAIVLSPEQVKARAERQAAEHAHAPGESCDKGGPKRDGSGQGAGCDAPVHDNRVFMIRGTGAVIYG
jgi:hypothetical protein